MTAIKLCGLDEAGRGPLAGPIVAAAVVFPPGFDFCAHFPKVRFGDSKQMTSRQREAAYDLILVNALVWGVEQIDVPIIDRCGIGWANRAVFERLITAIDAEQYIVDGTLKLDVAPEKRSIVRSLVRADQSEQAVSAASIIAKVTRDRLMHQLHDEYPAYGWDHNAGYYSQKHMAAIREVGRSPYHRRQFVDTALAHGNQLSWRDELGR